MDSWLIWHFTSGHKHVTDVTNASRTLLYNIVKGEWDEELLRIFNVPASLLPEVAWSSEKVGEVTTTLGLGGVAIAGIAGDQQAALFGQLCWSAGEEHIWDRVFPAAERGHGVCALTASADYDAGGERGAAAGICAGGKHLYWRRGCAVAAR